MTSLTSVDKILQSFPLQDVPPLVGEPTFDSINSLHRILKANAASVPSALGGGVLGHLALVIPPTEYATLCPTPFTTPINPGPTPVHAIAGATAAQLAAEDRLHTESLRIWNLYQNTDKALKRQLLSTVESIYVRALSNRNTGFANVTTLALIQHLLRVHGRITAHDLEENFTRFKKPWDPNAPFETLIEQMDDAVDFANAGGIPISAPQLINTAYTLLFNTGAFADACREWRRRPAVDHTWDNFKIHFAIAHEDNRLVQQHTTQGGGYHTANNAMDSFVTDTAEAFANLATAAASDRDVLRTLTNTNNDLLQQLSAKDAEISKLRSQLGSTKPPRGHSNHNGNNDENRPPRDPNKKRFKNDNYCWSHGYDIHPTHNSSSCHFPREGHKKEATRCNTMGGSQIAINNKY
jgi:hypothetical protein